MLSEKGYTFIEFILILAIIAIISLVAISSFKAVHRYELKKEAEIVGDTIRDAQKMAMSENKVLDVKINGNNVIMILEGATRKKEVTLKKGVEFYPNALIGQTIIRYSTKGTPDGAISVIKEINLKNDYKIAIHINDVTGKVELGEITN